MEFSPDGEALFTAGTHRDILLSTVADGRRLTRIMGHGERVEALALSHDGKLLASADHHGQLKLWETTGWTEPLELEGHGR